MSTSRASILIRTEKNIVLPHGLVAVQHGEYLSIQAEQFVPQEFKEAWFLNDDAPLPTLAKALSVHGPSLAMLNWQDEWLRLWAFQNTQLVFRYDSNPSYATCTVSPAEFNDAGALAALFGKPESAAFVSRLLLRRKGLGFNNESGRFAALLELLGAPRI